MKIVNAAGEGRIFEITVSGPVEGEDGEHSCNISSDNVLFRGKQKVFGIDSLDTLDYAIQFIDKATTAFTNGTLCWPDDTPYKRVLSTEKMEWGQ